MNTSFSGVSRGTDQKVSNMCNILTIITQLETRIRAGVVLDKLSNLSGFSFNLSLLSFPRLTSHVKLFSSLSLFVSFISSSLLFSLLLCCGVFCAVACSVLCCCVLLCVVVLCLCVSVCGCVMCLELNSVFR